MYKIQSAFIKSSFYFLLLILLIFYSCRASYASNYFFDDFNGSSIDSNKWFTNENGGSINFDGNYIRLSTGYTNHFPYITSIGNSIPQDGNFTVFATIEKTVLRSFGTSLAFSTTFPQNGILADININPYLYQQEQFINLVLRNHDLLVVFSGSCFDIPCSLNSLQMISIPENQIPTELNFKITYINRIYKIYLNNFETPIIESSHPTDIRPTGIWFGSPYSGGNSNWTPLNINNIYILNEPTASPTPIIFLPGYMGSLQWEDMKDNTSTHVWGPNPVAKVYDNFFDTLENLGMTEGDDFVRWDYDFRRPLPEISQKFTAFLDSFLSTKPAGTKAILIGHSFGGLVAKEYLLENGRDKIKKIITVGSPHEGVLDTYPWLAAGELGRADIWQKVPFEVNNLWHKNNYLNNREVVERTIPSAKDLLPILLGGYLKDVSGNVIYSIFGNPNLENQKNNFADSDILQILRGTSLPTRRFYVLSPRGIIDTVLNIWPDGSLQEIEYASAGDGTVLEESTFVAGAEVVNLPNLNHGEIVSSRTGISKILEAAEIAHNESQIIENPVPSIPQAILLLLRSPATIKITDTATGESAGEGAINKIENSIALNGNKFVFVPTRDGKKYDIEIVGTGNGTYQLDMAAISTATSSSVLSFEKSIKNNETDFYEIQYHEKANLISSTNTEIQNQRASVQTLLADLSKFVATSSATFSQKVDIGLKTFDLISDFQLIDELLKKANIKNASLQSQKSLMKTMSLKQNFNDLTREEKIEIFNKIFDIALSEKDLFSVINNSSSQVNQDKLTSLILALETIQLRTKEKLEGKILDGTAAEFQANDFQKAEELFTMAKRERDSLLFSESVFSSQIARFLFSDSLK